LSSPALLALEDGSLFRGVSIGAHGASVGEVVFNTAMTGYQEILTDPSYAKQHITLTYPHIGNTGCNAEDAESDRVWASGLIIRDLPRLASNYRMEEDLGSYLKKRNVVGIADIDTRRLTRLLRTQGALNGCIVAAATADEKLDDAKALTLARGFAGLNGMDLAKEVSCTKPYEWQTGEWLWGRGSEPVSQTRFTVVAYDYGVKHNILRMLASRGCRLTVVPAQTPASEVLKLHPDGIFLSNGPGDPAACDYAISAIKELLTTGIPIFGICLGHQILALASGAKTTKMKFGHHGANHPVKDLDDNTVMITSQNHGFAVEENALPTTLRATHKSLFDGSLQGIARNDVPAYSFQGHPEASPGPHDVAPLFDRFIAMMQQEK